MTDQTTEPEEESAFIVWLLQHQDGQTLIELDEAFAEVIGGVRNFGKKGNVSLSVGITQQGRTVGVLAEVKMKVPREPLTADVFFAGEDGMLHREDPFQAKLPFNVVRLETDDGSVKTVDADTGEIKKVGDK